jgi:capsule polysaccharide modification protein KpsS
MLKAIFASFLGTFLALAAIGAVALFVANKAIDRVATEISTRIEVRVAAAKEQAAAVMARVRAENGALAAALAAGRGKRELLAAFGECVAKLTDGGEQPAAAVESCLQEYAWVEP